MSHNDLLRSLRDAWGVEVDREPQTIRGVIELGHAALQDQDLVTDLRASGKRFCDMVARVVDECIHDIDTTPDIDPGLLPHLEGSLEGYQAISDGVEELADAKGDIAQAVAWLEEGVELQRSHQQGIELWQNQPSCPLCGIRSQQSRVCDKCGVQLIIPDPNPPELPSLELGEKYVELRKVAGLVATGKTQLSALGQAVDDLASDLFRLSRLLKKATAGGVDAAPMLQVLEGAFAGLERMQSFETTCAIADLNQGWAAVSQAGVKLQELAEELSV
jgi:hypothetical protein